MDSMVGEPSTSQHDTAPYNPVATVETDYKGWMNKFCDEPVDDIGTCCLGFWLPCVLYGKIDDRLQLLQSGKDPRKVGNGCNGSCLVWTASGYGFGGILTANRRSRVRGTYGIEGSIKKDYYLSIFCPRCTLMQMDREMRARDGEMELRTCPVYKKTQVVNVQPGPNQEMRYLSEPGSRPSPQARPPTGLKHHKLISKRQHPLQQVFNASGADQVLKAAVKCAKSSGSKQAKFHKSPKDEGRSMPVQAHALADCVVATSANPDSSTVRTHNLSDCTGVDISNTSPSKRAVSEHSITDCETILVGGRRSSNGSAAQMSYVHDFTDCPVDREVLEYLEEEEKKSKGHGLEDCPILALPQNGDSERRPAAEESTDPALPDCCLNDTAGKDPVEPHQLSECMVLSSNPPSAMKTVGQKSVPSNSADVIADLVVPDCCLADSSNTESVQQHNLSDCKRLSSTAPALMVPIEENEHPQSTQADSVGESPPRQAELPDCCEDDHNVAVAPQHRLSECSRSSSLSALIVQKAEQHRLSQCLRSSSLPTIESRRTSEHGLDDRNQMSPVAGEMASSSKNPYSRNTHNLEDCHCDESSESSQQSEGIVKKADKGKQRDGQGQPSFASKKVDSNIQDVVVAVDVIVGGNKFKATMIGTTDGSNSPRPSEIRERSAQQALEKVLTASQRQISQKATETKGSRKHPYQRYPRAKNNRHNNNS